MSNGVQDPNTTEQNPASEVPSDPKGKGKMVETSNPDMMEEDEDEDESEEDEEGEGEAYVEDADEDNMEEIDMDNIVGSRTRGKNIDYAQAAKELDPEDEEDDEDDDDFEDPDEDRMEE